MIFENFDEMKAIYPALDKDEVCAQAEKMYGGKLPESASLRIDPQWGSVRISVSLKDADASKLLTLETSDRT